MKLDLRLASLTMTTFLTLAGCGIDRSPSSSKVSGTEAVEGTTRAHGAYIAFSKWTDTVQLDLGLAPEGDGCKLADPRTRDDSTRWSPIQTYWVVRDNQRDVRMDSIHETFFEGDAVTTADYPGSLGFSFLTADQASRLPLSNFRVSADGTTVDVDAGNPFNSKLRVQAVKENDACVLKSMYCKNSTNCAMDANYRPLAYAYVRQNFLGIPVEVIYH